MPTDDNDLAAAGLAKRTATLLRDARSVQRRLDSLAAVALAMDDSSLPLLRVDPGSSHPTALTARRLPRPWHWQQPALCPLRCLCPGHPHGLTNLWLRLKLVTRNWLSPPDQT